MAPVSTDVSGNATIGFEPGLRKAVFDGIAIEVNSPWLYLSQQDDVSAPWALDVPVQHTFSIKTIEAFEL